MCELYVTGLIWDSKGRALMAQTYVLLDSDGGGDSDEIRHTKNNASVVC